MKTSRRLRSRYILPVTLVVAGVAGQAHAEEVLPQSSFLRVFDRAFQAAQGMAPQRWTATLFPVSKDTRGGMATGPAGAQLSWFYDLPTNSRSVEITEPGKNGMKRVRALQLMNSESRPSASRITSFHWLGGEALYIHHRGGTNSRGPSFLFADRPSSYGQTVSQAEAVKIVKRLGRFERRPDRLTSKYRQAVRTVGRGR